MMNNAFSDCHQLLGKRVTEDELVRAAIGEEIQRRPGLLEHRPEEAAAMKNTTMSTSRLRSAGVQLPVRNSQAKKPR